MRVLLFFLFLPLYLFSQVKIDTQKVDNVYFKIVYKEPDRVAKETLYSVKGSQLYFMRELSGDSILEVQYDYNLSKPFISWKGSYKKRKQGREGNLYHYDSAGNILLRGELSSTLSYLDTVKLFEYSNGILQKSYIKLLYNTINNPYLAFESNKAILGNYIEYYKNGNKKLEGQYDNSGVVMVRDGVWREYYENGKLKGEGEYKTTLIVPTGDGNFGVEKERIEDKIGTWKYYSEEGELIRSENYSKKVYKDEFEW